MIFCWSIFLGASQPSIISQLRILYLALYPIFNQGLLKSNFFNCLYICIGYQPPVVFRIGKDLLPIWWLPFYLNDSVLYLTEALQFYEVPFVNCCSYSTSHWCSVQKLFPCVHMFEVLLLFLFYKFQWIWFYVEVLDQLGLELCTRR